MVDDDLDLEKFRWPDEGAARAAAAKAKANAGHSPTGKPGQKRSPSKKRFTKFPYAWEEALAEARVSGSTYAVAIVLLHEAWKLTSSGCKPAVKLTNVMLEAVYVGRKGKRTALRALTELKLVAVEYRPNRNPLVTVRHFLD